jgi:hypothetical protein
VDSLLFGGRKLVQVCRTGFKLSRGTLNKWELSNPLNRLKIGPNFLSFRAKFLARARAVAIGEAIPNGLGLHPQIWNNPGTEGEQGTLGGQLRTPGSQAMLMWSYSNQEAE